MNVLGLDRRILFRLFIANEASMRVALRFRASRWSAGAFVLQTAFKAIVRLAAGLGQPFGIELFGEMRHNPPRIDSPEP
jgi:hypothetical protein